MLPIQVFRECKTCRILVMPESLGCAPFLYDVSLYSTRNRGTRGGSPATLGGSNSTRLQSYEIQEIMALTVALVKQWLGIGLWISSIRHAEGSARNTACRLAPVWRRHGSGM